MTIQDCTILIYCWEEKSEKNFHNQKESDALHQLARKIYFKIFVANLEQRFAVWTVGLRFIQFFCGADRVVNQVFAVRGTLRVLYSQKKKESTHFRKNND